MPRLYHGLFLLACSTLLWVASVGGQYTKPVPAVTTPAEIERIIRQMGSDDYFEREAASKELAAIGEPAREALEKAANGNDAEVQRRASKLVEALDAKVYRELRCFKGHMCEVRSA